MNYFGMWEHLNETHQVTGRTCKSLKPSTIGLDLTWVTGAVWQQLFKSHICAIVAHMWREDFTLPSALVHSGSSLSWPLNVLNHSPSPTPHAQRLRNYHPDSKISPSPPYIYTMNCFLMAFPAPLALALGSKLSNLLALGEEVQLGHGELHKYAVPSYLWLRSWTQVTIEVWWGWRGGGGWLKTKLVVGPSHWSL